MPAPDIQSLTYYLARDEGVLPSGARFPWTAVGAGGSLTDKGVTVAGSTAVNAYRRQEDRALVEDRVDVQATFRSSTNSPGWASGAGGHVIAIDDGQRALGLSIGDTIEFIDPSDGSVVYSIPSAAQPGGATTLRTYLLIKDGTSGWEAWVDGRLIAVLPYVAAATATYDVGTITWGWLDASGSGSALWDGIETGINEIVAPK